jgi:dipeptidyl aminopeptidase/acylaminoacyl peptidase
MDANLIRITNDGRRKLSPAFLPGGEEIIFSVHDVPNRVVLKRLRLSDGHTENLFPNGSEHLFDPAYSRDGKLLAYAKSSGSPQLVLVIHNLIEVTEKTFLPLGARSTARTPKFLPDGSRVVFMHSAPGGQQIASVDRNGGDLKLLTQSQGMNCWPDVSPDGTRIAFSSSRDGHFQIYSMTAAGDDVRRLTHSPTRDMRPAWSPDGRRIAFTSTRDGRHELYVMQSDGSDPRRLTDHPERDDFPVWHPDGRRILCISERDGQSDLYLAQID